MKTWKSTLVYCEGLALAGNSDWRLLNVKELESLADDSRYNPAIDTTFFPGTNVSVYWSSTSNAHNGLLRWGMIFLDGVVGNYYKPYVSYIRFVRRGQWLGDLVI